ncbi:DUF2490 domain-containing protein [Rhodocytophaga aerolata]|uniref:DUF2490 domain-containing protein n=1 Tax=Rhodocytophaga aerolata TaxID=455078 RepID=A0ABT8RF72_9BACT|nr:DUF2490 domain-containing protein [Rhodocytophaga aerolata]MDO1449425.1 DUF2490 domain-containing protein [Rhodocytophaga aerolata]
MKHKIQYLVASVLGIVLTTGAQAQVTSPGQGGKAVVWTALEVQQQLNKRWTSYTTIGIGRHSHLTDYAVIEQQGTFTLRQGMAYKLSRHFTFSLTAMYGNRAYYEESLPPYQQEIRLYPKLSHSFKRGNFSFSQALRLDIRRFYQPDWSSWKDPLELRPRYQGKATLPLSGNKTNSLIVLTEVMGSAKGAGKQAGFTLWPDMKPFHFTENRTSLYFRHHLSRLNWDLDLGLMHQYWRLHEHTFISTMHVAVDLIIKNPFSVH